MHMIFAKSISEFRSKFFEGPMGPSRHLGEFLKANPAMKAEFDKPAASASMADVFPWQDLQDQISKDRSFSWNPRSGSAQPTLMKHMPKFVTKKEHPDGLAFDVRDLRGISASRADLDSYRSVDEMISAERPDLVIASGAPALAGAREAFEKVSRRRGDCVIHFGWEEGVWFNNTDGSHRAAALHVHATRMNEPTAIDFPAREYRLDGNGLRALGDKYHVFMVKDDAGIHGQLHQHLTRAGATWSSTRFDHKEQMLNVLFFEKRDPSVGAAVKKFVEAGYVDVVDHLQGVYLKQDDHAPRLHTLSQVDIRMETAPIRPPAPKPW